VGSNEQITLELKPQDAAKLVFAKESGTVWLVLLPPKMQGKQIKPVDLTQVLKDSGYKVTQVG
jgi:hypothetical protein